MKVEGQLTISRVRGSADYVNIEFRDEKAGVLIAQAEVDISNFGEAITGLAHVSCQIKVNPSDKIGKTREHKTVEIETPDQLSYDTPVLKDLLKPHEVDGWVGRIQDLQNMHKRIRNNIYDVVFERWV